MPRQKSVTDQASDLQAVLDAVSALRSKVESLSQQVVSNGHAASTAQLAFEDPAGSQLQDDDTDDEADDDDAEWCECERFEARGAPASRGVRTRAELAQAILDSRNIKLSTVHPSGVVDQANARQNIIDTAAGRAARRSSYGTAPGGTVQLSQAMLNGILKLADTYRFTITELCGASHSPTSRHYAGIGFDVNEINGRHVGASHPDQLAFRRRCNQLGATEVLGPGRRGHSTHIHAAWPRTAARTMMTAEAVGTEVSEAAEALTFNDFALRPANLEFVRTAEGTADDDATLSALAADHDLELPMERLISLRNDRYPASRPRYWAIANFDLHSSEPRMFVFDVVASKVSAYLCAHGVNSDRDGFAAKFSNKKGSKASSLGIYRCAETYESHKNGHSLRLDGLEKTNDNARARAVVIHGADYVSDAFAKKHKRVGVSEGCPALDRAISSKVIDQLKLGSLLMIWKTP